MGSEMCIRDRAFTVQKNVKGENIVLIDDIYTTGSTLDEAARVLKKAGAENVYFLTVSMSSENENVPKILKH